MRHRSRRRMHYCTSFQTRKRLFCKAVPVFLSALDVYQENDLESVVAGVGLGANAAANNNIYKQVRIPDSDHFFKDMSRR